MVPGGGRCVGGRGGGRGVDDGGEPFPEAPWPLQPPRWDMRGPRGSVLGDIWGVGAPAPSTDIRGVRDASHPGQFYIERTPIASTGLCNIGNIRVHIRIT